MTPAIATVNLEKMQSPRGPQPGVCVRPKQHLHEFLGAHARKIDRQETSSRVFSGSVFSVQHKGRQPFFFAEN